MLTPPASVKGLPPHFCRGCLLYASERCQGRDVKKWTTLAVYDKGSLDTHLMHLSPQEATAGL